MGRMKELIADDWDRAYAKGYRQGYMTALRWAFDAFEALQNEQQTSELQGDQKLIELINLTGEQP